MLAIGFCLVQSEEGLGIQQAFEADVKDTVGSDEEEDKLCHRLFAWASCELLWREVYNLYRPTGICSFSVGHGAEALASARMKIKFVGFVLNELHMRFVQEYCVASILSEQLDAVDDGFLLRRFLSRERSIGGGGEATGSEQPEDDAGQPEGSPSKTGASPAPGSKDGSSCSSSDSDDT